MLFRAFLNMLHGEWINIMYMIFSLLLGYAFGNILTAEIVIRKALGKTVFEVGTGNPGMANVMARVGFKEGAIVLAGDLAKTVLPCVIARFLLFPGNRYEAAAFAGLGAVLGHNFPIWHKFKGGKGVSATCAAIFCVQPAVGILSMLVGMYVTFLTNYLPIGAVFIPAAFAVFSYFLFGTKVFIAGIILTIFMFIAHRKGIAGAIRGTEHKVTVLKNANEKFGKYTAVIFLLISFAVAGLLILYMIKKLI